MNSNSIVFAIFLTLNSCSHLNKQEFDQSLLEGRCDEALILTPENQESYKVKEATTQGLGTMVSYTLTGAAYSAEILWDFSAGIVTAVTLIPLFPLMYAPEALLNKKSIKSPFPGLFAPKLGKVTYQSTESLRCPKVDELSLSVRKIAKCFYDNGGKENTERAVKILKSVRSSNHFISCLSSEELNAYTEDLKTFEKL